MANPTKYRNHRILKVTQDSGRVTYDTHTPDGDLLELASESYAVAKAVIDATIEQQERYLASRSK